MKLIFEFSKTGDMVYISHLDLMRLFLRVLRMSGLKPAYSHGFNPHPKISIALPLPVGVLSTCELIEFETDESVLGSGSDEAIDNAVFDANQRMPEGMHIKAWYKKPEGFNKSLASQVSAAVYEFMCDSIEDAPGKLESFFKNENIFIKKTDKKTGAEVEKDVRKMMLGYSIVKDMSGRMLAEATLSAAPSETLGPIVFFKAFCDASGLETDSLMPIITRTAILDNNNKNITESL
jgi:radical SAM-linked protein